MAREIGEEYASSLADLTMNSKPLINMLTILAEENVEHAGVIVESVEKHLEKVNADVKLPVLYLVDSIIKNVGGAYTTKFSQSIVDMFTRTFKQVDEKTRSQMFKLRETWHDVFPATKLYLLDMRVAAIDPAWPVQGRPQANIHVNPNFVKKPVATPVATTSMAPPTVTEEEEMRLVLAKKEQELLKLQQKKIELELVHTRRQLELAKKNAKKALTVLPPVAPVIPPAPAAPVISELPAAAIEPPPSQALPAKQRLGPPVNKAATGRIAPVSGAMIAAARRDPRRDPRLARHAPPPPSIPHPIAPNVFDIKPLERVTKRKNVITIDVRVDAPQERREGWARDPRFKKKDIDERRKGERKNNDRRKAEGRKAKEGARIAAEDAAKIEPDNFDINATAKSAKNAIDEYMNRLADPSKINKLPPIPKLSRQDDSKEKKDAPSPVKRRKEAAARDRVKKKRDGKESSESTSSPEKKNKARKTKKEPAMEVDKEDEEMVAFKELKNYHKERYRRHNEKSESPDKTPEESAPALEPAAAESETPNMPEDVVENKDIDLRVLHPVVAEAKAAQIGQKRSSTETLEGKTKKSKTVFDRLFGNEDVDLRQLPQLEDTLPPKDSPGSPAEDCPGSPKAVGSPQFSPQPSPKQKDWHEVKDKTPGEEPQKGLSKLDLVRAKLAEATKGKDRLGRPLLFSKSPSLERERRRTISAEDTDLRPETDGEVNKESISLILTQAKEHYEDGKMDKNQYNTLMYQVMQLNEKLKLKEAKQRESLEVSKRKLRAQQDLANNLKLSPIDHNRFGDIDERITPALLDTPPNSHDVGMQDSDMRMGQGDAPKVLLPHPPMPPMFYPPMWRGMRPRGEDFGGPRRLRAPAPPFYRAKFDKRGPRPFEPRFGQPIPPKVGMCQGQSPVPPYHRSTPPPFGSPAQTIPPTDCSVLEYIDQDPMKTIDIDGVPREIRFYGETAVIMLDWDDPREIKFLPGARRITFDNKDSVVLNFNEGYKRIEIEDQAFDIRFGAPTRELFINGRWYECFFGAPPTALLIDGSPRMVKLDGPPPQVDIGKVKRTDLVAAKINMIIDAAHMCPVFLDSKVQKFVVNGQFYTIRFVDSLKTVLINDTPFEIEFGGLPKPIVIGTSKHFVRFSVLPRGVRPGCIEIANMEGTAPEPQAPSVASEVKEDRENHVTETDQLEELPRPSKVLSPDGESNQGLDMLASLMPSSMAPASAFSGYSLGSRPAGIPGLEASPEDARPPPDDTRPPAGTPALGNLNVNDLFAKLIATGIVQVPAANEQVKEDVKAKPKEDTTVVHPVDFMKPATFRVKQPALVARLYGGMQCSGCGARFPPEHTVRYSQHLDWHFRQNRRERDSARRAHSRHWHYDLSDWVEYEEVEDLEEREKSWFETGGAECPGEGAPEPTEEPPSVAAGAPVDHHCALCGDKFHQFYNEDQEEWHLRKAVRHEDKNYHPLCFEDYKTSLAKEALPLDDSVMEVMAEPAPPEEPIEIRDGDDDVVEVLEDAKGESQDALEVDDDGDEDDVIYKAEPVDEVVVDDEADTDDETQAERRARDDLADIDFKKVKVKQEPIDADDEPVVTAEEEAVLAKADSSQNQVLVSSIDGNVQLEAAPAPATGLGIRINITKTIPTLIQPRDTSLEDVSADDEPLPPGEEPELEYKVKQSLQGVQFSRQPPVSKGSELSGLCSIM